MEKLCSFELWKTTQIIHGNVRLHTGRSAYGATRFFFWNRYLSKRINPTDEGLAQARTIHIDAWREVSVDQFSITIEDRDTAVNTASENYFFIKL
jgi:hypothetical protein